MSRRFINCEVCQTEGRIYTANGNDPDWKDHGVCPECNGERVVEVETLPVEMEDIDDRMVTADEMEEWDHERREKLARKLEY